MIQENTQHIQANFSTYPQWGVVLGSPDITHFAGIKIVVRVPRYALQTHTLPGGPLQPGTNEFHKVRTLTEVYRVFTHVLPEL